MATTQHKMTGSIATIYGGAAVYLHRANRRPTAIARIITIDGDNPLEIDEVTNRIRKQVESNWPSDKVGQLEDYEYHGVSYAWSTLVLS